MRKHLHESVVRIESVKILTRDLHARFESIEAQVSAIRVLTEATDLFVSDKDPLEMETKFVLLRATMKLIDVQTEWAEKNLAKAAQAFVEFEVGEKLEETNVSEAAKKTFRELIKPIKSREEELKILIESAQEQMGKVY